MMARIEDVFADQAAACRDLGSPFTAALLERLPRALTAETRFGARILDWPGDPRPDALALRAAGALHGLARSGAAPELVAVYPPEGGEISAALLAETLARHDARLAPWLDSAPQTNEVGRSAIILGGALNLAARFAMALEILEIGASAGLNLGFDRYRYELGRGRVWGDSSAPVTISCDWRGAAPPLDAPLQVADRAGADLAPLDPAETPSPMLAYIWPDQTARLARAEAALAAAAAAPWRVERADAADWLARRLAAPQASGRARVVLHTIVWQYLPRTTQAAAAAAIRRAGAAASPDRPFAWLRLEPDDEAGSAAIRLSVWPGGDDALLGRGDFHGRWAAWR